MAGRKNDTRTPPLKLAGLVLLVILGLVFTFVVLQYRGTLTPKTDVTLISSRAGLVMDPGGKVTYNGLPVGRVISVEPLDRNGKQVAQLNLEINNRYIPLIPANVGATIDATTIFGNKYVSLKSPADPTKARLSSSDEIDATNVTTEFNTLFETVTSLAEKVDPVKLNLTLSAAAEALTGLGGKLGVAINNANAALDELNPQLPTLQFDLQQLVGFADVYTTAAPDLLDALDNISTSARTIYAQRGDLDAALLAAVGFGNTGADVFERGAPYLVRAIEDLVPTSQVLDTYSPAIHCTLRGAAEALPLANATLGGNGYSLRVLAPVLGAPNPYAFPDNMPRTNARGGPGGAPGCFQDINNNFWPAPTVVADTGFTLSPYNHFELGQPLLAEYVWGRQFGENTINP
ncbi:MAG: MCE family protein [Mycobacterium sp.]